MQLSIAECALTSRKADLPGVVAFVDDARTAHSNTSVDHNDLFTFEDEAFVYCAPTSSGSPITITITFPETVILLEIDIHGNDQFLPILNEYVTNFSLSYARDDGTFVPYIQDTGSEVCAV